MKILITGSTGYIGKRLMPLLLNEGHTVVCSVRDTSRTIKHNEDEYIEVVEADFLKPETLKNIPKHIDVAYYLIHSMSNASEDFKLLEAGDLHKREKNLVRFYPNRQGTQSVSRPKNHAP